jgi:transposase
MTLESDHVVPASESQAVSAWISASKRWQPLATATSLKGPKARSFTLKRLPRPSRAHPRKITGSANRKKSAARLVRLCARIAHVRGDGLHKLTTLLVSALK